MLIFHRGWWRNVSFSNISWSHRKHKFLKANRLYLCSTSVVSADFCLTLEKVSIELYWLIIWNRCNARAKYSSYKIVNLQICKKVDNRTYGEWLEYLDIFHSEKRWGRTSLKKPRGCPICHILCFAKMKLIQQLIALNIVQN